MKNKSITANNLFSSVLIILNFVVSALMFLPIYNDNAVLPGYDSLGNSITVKVKYPIAPYARLVGSRIEWILFVAFILFAVALILLVICFIKKQTNLNKARNITLITSTVLFLILLALAAIQTALY
ncbi:MAG: hypothetical protein WC193_05465 [Bacilli bacterium]|jgi:hypothetical protein